MEMLELEERRGIYEEMQLQMLQAGPLQVGSLVFTWVGMHGTRIDGNSRFDLYASSVLNYCERYGWIEEPALLVALIEKIAPTAKTKYAAEQLPVVAVRLRTQRPSVADFYRNAAAWETCHLSATLPFLNRDITRRAFEKFFNPLGVANVGDAARVLVVNGPQGSGKTFTGDFLRMLVGVQLPGAKHAVARADFTAFLTGEPLTPDRLAAHLGKEMGVGPQELEEAVRGFRANDRPKDIAIWLAKVAYDTKKTWHLVLDNFHHSAVPDATLLFIEQLLAGLEDQGSIAWDIRDPNMGVPLRLVLLGYKGKLPEQPRLVEVDEIKPVTAEDLRKHFRRYFIYKEWPVDEAEVDQIVKPFEEELPNLFPAVEPAPPGGKKKDAPGWKMEVLAAAVLEYCKQLELMRAGTAAPSGVSTVLPGGVPAGDLANG